MALVDDIATRLRAIIGGTYPSPTPYITLGTFDTTETFLPKANARFPSGTRSAIKDRRCDIAWESLVFDPEGSENSTQGPWVRSATARISVQYELQHPDPATPTDVPLSIGALERATRWALDDAALIQWACLRPGAFDGLAIGVLLVDPVTAAREGQHRAIGTTRVRFLLSQSATTSPGIAS